MRGAWHAMPCVMQGRAWHGLLLMEPRLYQAAKRRGPPHCVASMGWALRFSERQCRAERGAAARLPSPACCMSSAAHTHAGGVQYVRDGSSGRPPHLSRSTCMLAAKRSASSTLYKPGCGQREGQGRRRGGQHAEHPEGGGCQPSVAAVPSRQSRAMGKAICSSLHVQRTRTGTGAAPRGGGWGERRQPPNKRGASWD